MQSERWAFSTKKREISFAGASPWNYTTPWDLGPSETEIPRNEPLAAFVICGSTISTSTAHIRVSLQSLGRCLNSDWIARADWGLWDIATAVKASASLFSESMSRYLYEAAFKDVFVSALGGTYGRSIERLFDEPTSDLPVVRVSSLPQEVR